MVPGFDSHAHLHFDHFADDLDQVVKRAALAGITHVMIPSVDPSTAELAASIAMKYSLWSASAFHPEHLPESLPEEGWKRIRKTLLEPRTIAVGETGLDFHHNTFPLKDQLLWFHRHIELASALGFPLIVHSRKAEEAVLAELPSSVSVPVILHCWNGNRELTRAAVSRGFYIGVDGPITYRKSGRLRETISSVPLELLLAETDSPFLPPEPFRGRRNEPAYTRLVIETLRELYGGDLSIEGMLFMLWENAMRAFRLHPLNRRADIAYKYGNSVYINLTVQCQNNCSFCVRRHSDGIAGYFLRHREDPSDELVLSSLSALPLEDYREIVFCGYGEPTLRSDLLVKCAESVHKRGIRTRLNTNGLCTSFMTVDSISELLGSVDSVSISLNASGEKEYNRICSSSVESAWEHLLKFVKLTKASGKSAGVTAVSGSGADICRVKTLSERLGVPLRVRGE